MRFLFWQFQKAPHTPKTQLVNDVSAIVDLKLTEVWQAIGKTREDLTTTHRLAAATQRQLYRKIGPDTEPDDDGSQVNIPAGKQTPKTWRTGDPVPDR